MELQHLWAVSFRPVGGTRTAVDLLAGELGDALRLPCEEIDFTSPAARTKEYHFGRDDLVIIGSPVYAGRLPNKIMPEFRRCFHGDGTMTIPIVTYGNRRQMPQSATTAESV